MGYRARRLLRIFHFSLVSGTFLVNVIWLALACQVFILSPDVMLLSYARGFRVSRHERFRISAVGPS
jgi:hypothetical protein